MNIIDWFKNLFHKKEESNIPSKAIDFYLTSLETTAQIDNNKFKTIYYEPDPAFLSAKIDSDPRKIIFPSEFGKKINKVIKKQNNDGSSD